MVKGLYRALVATFLASLVLVVTVPKHYLHACDHDHAEQVPLDTDRHDALVLGDHHCAICDLVIPSFAPEVVNCVVLELPLVMQLVVLAPTDAVVHRSDRSVDRGPPALS
jgi:hypothetical protein